MLFLTNKERSLTKCWITLQDLTRKQDNLLHFLIVVDHMKCISYYSGIAIWTCSFTHVIINLLLQIDVIKFFLCHTLGPNISLSLFAFDVNWVMTGVMHLSVVVFPKMENTGRSLSMPFTMSIPDTMQLPSCVLDPSIICKYFLFSSFYVFIPCWLLCLLAFSSFMTQCVLFLIISW